MDSLFLLYLKHNLEKDMQEIENEYPSIFYKSICTKQIKSHESFITTFRILYSGNKGKLKSKLHPEEKIKISKGNFVTKGSIVSVEEENVVINCNRTIDYGEYDITRISNYNNEIVKKKLELFIDNEKIIPHKITEGWINNLKIQIFKKYKLEITNENEIIDFLYMKCLEKKYDEGKSTVSDQQIPDLENLAKNIDRLITYDANNEEIKFEIDKIDNGFTFYDDTLNFNQKAAVIEHFKNESYKIIGPPGTGKTRTIVEIICQLLKFKKEILVCAPSNIAIDNIIERFMSSKYYNSNDITFYRLGSSQKGLAKYNLDNQVTDKTKFVEKEKNEKNYKRNLEKLQRQYKLDIQEEAKVVFGTLFSSLREHKKFDWILVDEACQANDVETFLCLVKAKNFIIIGDPNQLCPKTYSLFEKLYLKTFLLNVQYRMCSKLISFSNSNFYNNQIFTYKEGSHALVSNSPVLLIDTNCSDYNDSEFEKSKFNLGEAEIVIKIVKILKSTDIGIITPYSAQAFLLKSKLSENIEINTVDGFQGREKEYIILSLVRSNNLSEIGFLDDYRRLNVAITRCKKGLIVVGDSQNFKKSKILSNFFKHLENNFLSIDPSEIDDYF